MIRMPCRQIGNTHATHAPHSRGRHTRLLQWNMRTYPDPRHFGCSCLPSQLAPHMLIPLHKHELPKHLGAVSHEQRCLPSRTLSLRLSTAPKFSSSWQHSEFALLPPWLQSMAALDTAGGATASGLKAKLSASQVAAGLCKRLHGAHAVHGPLL